MLTAEQKAKWVAALRSGDYNQGKHMLHNQRDNTFCCLGVLCEVMGYENGSADINGQYVRYKIDDQWHATSLPETVLGEDQDMKHRNHVMRMNDTNGRSFVEIADYIEEHLQTYG